MSAFPSYTSYVDRSGLYRTNEKVFLAKPRAEFTQARNHPVVLCHGLLSDSSYWADQSKVPHFFRAFGDRGFSVFGPDLDGGATMGNVSSLAAMYDGIEYLQYNQGYDVSLLYLIGVSMGAMTACNFAVRNIDQVAGLALVVPLVMADAIHDANVSSLAGAIEAAYGGSAATWEARKWGWDPYLQASKLKELGDAGKLAVFYCVDDTTIPQQYVTPFITSTNAKRYTYRGDHLVLENQANTALPYDVATWLSERRAETQTSIPMAKKRVNWKAASPAVPFPGRSVGIPANDWTQFSTQTISSDGVPANTYTLSLDTGPPRAGRITTATGSKGNERHWLMYTGGKYQDSFIRTSCQYVAGSPQMGVGLRAQPRRDGRWHGFIGWSDALFSLSWIWNFGLWVSETTPGAGGVELRSNNANFGKAIAKPITFTASARASNVATLTVPSGHGITAGKLIRIDHPTDASFSHENVSVTSVTATTVVYASTGSNVGNAGAGEVRDLTANAGEMNVELRVIGMTLSLKIWGKDFEYPSWSNTDHVRHWMASQESPSLAGDIGPREEGYPFVVYAHMPTGDIGAYGPTTLGAA